MKLQAFEASNRKSLQSQMLPRPENRLLLNRFGGSSRPTETTRWRAVQRRLVQPVFGAGRCD
jgi:hypothetical protein